MRMMMMMMMISQLKNFLARNANSIALYPPIRNPVAYATRLHQLQLHFYIFGFVISLIVMQLLECVKTRVKSHTT